jgi:hypothetical protein
MACREFTRSRSICALKSGPASITKFFSFIFSSNDDRKRLSFSSVEQQTSQSQAITGTPCEVPVPRNVASIGIFPSEYILQI